MECYERKVKMLALYEVVLRLSNGPDKKERTKRNKHVEMQKGGATLPLSLLLLSLV